jgi:hypothetical protein
MQSTESRFRSSTIARTGPSRFGNRIFSAKIPNLMDFMSEDAGVFYPGQEAEPVGHRGRTPSRDRARTSCHWNRSIPQKPIPAPLFLYSCAKAFQAAPFVSDSSLPAFENWNGDCLQRSGSAAGERARSPRSSVPT